MGLFGTFSVLTRKSDKNSIMAIRSDSNTTIPENMSALMEVPSTLREIAEEAAPSSVN